MCVLIIAKESFSIYSNTIDFQCERKKKTKIIKCSHFFCCVRTISLELRLRNRADTVKFEYVCISTTSISFVLMSICQKWKQNETKLLLMNNRKQTILNRVSPTQHKPNTFYVCVSFIVNVQQQCISIYTFIYYNRDKFSRRSPSTNIRHSCHIEAPKKKREENECQKGKKKACRKIMVMCYYLNSFHRQWSLILY